MTQFSEHTSPEVRHALELALEDRPVGVEDGVLLLDARGPDLHALLQTADELRRRHVGDDVTYVVNRNINFTNVCVKNCRFCAFSREIRSEQGYFLPAEEVIRRATEAAELGATEVCIQAGLAPSVDGRIYIDICRAVHEALPDVHIHAFSPEEVKYGAGLSGMSYREYLSELKDAGLGSLPGTSAEILDEDLRKSIAPGRITARQWIDVVSTAHDLGIPTTATMMFGHVETLEHRARHMDLLRSIQLDTGGFTEFVPLSFVHEEAPLFVKGEHGTRPGPTGNDVLRLYAVARLMLGASFRNIQASWVKEGLRTSQFLLDCGVNDLGGTLINESISTSAGARHGQLMRPAELRRIIVDAGRTPVERTTLYRPVRADDDAHRHPLDAVSDADERFGTYASLAQSERFRYDFDEYRAARRAQS